jgi:hypothetical protein
MSEVLSGKMQLPLARGAERAEARDDTAAREAASPLLPRIESPADLKTFDASQLRQLADELW